MYRLRARLIDHFDRNPTQVPVCIASVAIFLAVCFASIVVYFDVHKNGQTLILFTALIASSIAIPAAIIQYRREASIEKQKQTLHGLASTDALTGIMNRRSFRSAVGMEQSRMERTGDVAALILFDLDHFKQINDTFGHDAGDRMLVAVAEVAWAELRNPLDYLARWGGEEFAIFLNGVSIELAERAAERLRRAIANLKVVTEDQTVSATASFGVTTLTASCDLDDAFRAADRALYKAKRSGRDQTVITARNVENTGDERAA